MNLDLDSLMQRDGRSGLNKKRKGDGPANHQVRLKFRMLKKFFDYFS